MISDTTGYVPTLAIRPSEMNGLEHLPGATKDRMMPCILLAPWMSSKTLDAALKRVEKAYRNRKFFMDPDRDYSVSDMERGPQREFHKLRMPSDAFANWVEFVARHDWIVPCIQTYEQSASDIRKQVERYQELGRGYCLRVVRERFPINMEQVISALAASGAADFAVILEGGWVRDPLTLEAWFRGVIENDLHEIDARVPIVVSCTSMPKEFDSMSGVTKVQFLNRNLFNNLSHRFSNRSRLVYGDWGSTRPREPKDITNPPLDRVDYPTTDAWWIARNKGEKWSFQDAARRIVNRADVWSGHLGIWGEALIRATAAMESLGVNTPQKNVAARVNIHMHRQAFFDEPNLSSLDLDDSWED